MRIRNDFLRMNKKIALLWPLIPIFGTLLCVHAQGAALDESAIAGGKPCDPQLVSMNFKETDIREVLNILAYKGEVNIVAGEDVNAKISVQLKDVPWEEALDIILKTYNYTYKKDGSLIRVVSLSRSLEEEGKIPLVTKIVPLNFAGVEDLKGSLEKILSKRGTIQVDKRTNSLIITDIPEMVDSVEKAALNLDSRTPQVLIEAMMVEVKITDENQMGTDLDIFDLKSPDNGNKLETTMAGNVLNKFNFKTLTENFDITGVIDLWASQNKVTVLANPKVLTLDNKEAKIEITEEIPYLETVDSGSGTTTNVKFKEAGIKLYVTPHITSGRYISMNVKPEQSFKASEMLGQPLIDSRKAETNLLVRDGQTVVIGGLRQSKDNITYEKVPFIGDVPFLGLFFRKKVVTKVETELVLFVTPRIIQNSILTERQQKMYDQLDNTAKIYFDERSEIQKVKDLAKTIRDKLKAKKIEEKEVYKRKGVQEEARGLENIGSEREQMSIDEADTPKNTPIAEKTFTSNVKKGKKSSTKTGY